MQSFPLGLIVVALVAILAGCATPPEAMPSVGPANVGSNSTGEVPLTDPPAEPSVVAGATTVQTAEIDLVIESGANLSARSAYAGDERRIELPANATHGLVIATWEPSVPTGERLVIQVFDGPFMQDGNLIVEAQGESPLEFEVPTEQLRYWHFIAKPAEFQFALDQSIHIRAEIEHMLDPGSEPSI